MLIERFGLYPDTAGAGKFRGGLGLIRDFRILADEATFQLRTDRTDFLPWGVEGGKPGTPTRNYLNPDNPTDDSAKGDTLPGKHLTALKKGDLYRMIQAGGGGYGDPSTGTFTPSWTTWSRKS